MYFALGVLVTGLVVVAIMPTIWRRALRLTRARAEASVPLSRAEISADRDKLRASFAATNRKLELQADQLRDRVSTQLVEINRERDVSSGLRREAAALREAVADLERTSADLTERLEAAESGEKDATAGMRARRRALEEREKELAELGRQHKEALQINEAQRLEQVARDTEFGNLRDSLSKAEVRAAQATTAAAALKADLAAEGLRLSEARARIEVLELAARRGGEARLTVAADLDRAAGAERAARLVADEQAIRLTRLERSLVDAAAERERIARASESGRSSLAGEIDTANREQRRLEQEVEAERQALGKTRVERDAAAARAATLEAEALEYQRDLAATRDDLDMRRAELGRLQEALASGEAALQTAEARVAQETEARERAERELKERAIEVTALNAELFATAGARAGTANGRASPATDRPVAEGFGGDNIQKSLAVAEDNNARLEAQVAALEGEARALRLENDRLRQLTAVDQKETDLGRKFEQVGDALARLSEAVDLEPGQRSGEQIERAPRRQPRDQAETATAGGPRRDLQ